MRLFGWRWKSRRSTGCVLRFLEDGQRGFEISSIVVVYNGLRSIVMFGLGGSVSSSFFVSLDGINSWDWAGRDEMTGQHFRDSGGVGSGSGLNTRISDPSRPRV